MFTRGAQCTSNFVFTDSARRVYLGYAAHCAGRGAATDTNGCSTSSLPLGTRVSFATGASLLSAGRTVGHGRLAYSSWRAMNRLDTKNANACDFNDFALVRVSNRDTRKVNPSVPGTGGPAGLAPRGPGFGSTVYSYGQSSLRPTTALSSKIGTSLGTGSGGWNTDVYTLTPGVPGDSGSGFVDSSGRAFGVLSTIALAPLAGSNGVSSLPKALAFAQKHSGIKRLRLVRGTERFSAPVG